MVYGEMGDGNESMEKNQSAVNEEKEVERDEEEEDDEDEEVAEAEEGEGRDEETQHKSGTSTRARILSEAVTKVSQQVYHLLPFPTPYILLVFLYTTHFPTRILTLFPR